MFFPPTLQFLYLSPPAVALPPDHGAFFLRDIIRPVQAYTHWTHADCHCLYQAGYADLQLKLYLSSADNMIKVVGSKYRRKYAKGKKCANTWSWWFQNLADQKVWTVAEAVSHLDQAITDIKAELKVSNCVFV